MPVKEERHDDAEINDLARKIAETNRAKLAQSAQVCITNYNYIFIRTPFSGGVIFINLLVCIRMSVCKYNLVPIIVLKYKIKT